MQRVTIARFPTIMEAHLALGVLHERGIDADVRNEMIVSADWTMGAATMGVEVQVPLEDREAATAIVEEMRYGEGDPAAAEERVANPEDPETVLSRRQNAAEQAARRAAISAVFGILFLPLQLYALYMVTQAHTRSAGAPWTEKTSRNVRNTLVIQAVVLGALLVAFLVKTRDQWWP